MRTNNDVANAAILKRSLTHVDGLIFGEDTAEAKVLNQKPDKDYPNDYVIYTRWGNPTPEKYLVYSTGLTGFMEKQAEEFRANLTGGKLLTEPIPLSCMMQIVSIHEVRHRLQKHSLKLYTPQNLGNALTETGIVIPAPEDLSSIEFDANVSTWMSLKKVQDHSRELTDKEIIEILLSEPKSKETR